jgi:hypothetical protein
MVYSTGLVYRTSLSVDTGEIQKLMPLAHFSQISIVNSKVNQGGCSSCDFPIPCILFISSRMSNRQTTA